MKRKIEIPVGDREVVRAFLIEWLKEEEPLKLQQLFDQAYRVKSENVGTKVYLRGLIELSNRCSKNCLYCGLRAANSNVKRYDLSDEQVLEGARYAWEANYGSIVLQAGERSDRAYGKRISNLIKKIKSTTNDQLGITLSLGEQSREVFKEWFEAGAHRYLLRIESSNRELYQKIHPNDGNHRWENRVQAILDLKSVGYQTGTGVMIGLPFQTAEELADDLLFMKESGIHMVGMGPYLRHSQTPMGELVETNQELTLTLKMVALLRLLMPRINIAATTAMQVLDPLGRERAVMAGANVIMPNMTIKEVREEYQIYEDKPGIDDDAAISKGKLEENLAEAGIEIGWGEWGDPKAYFD